jgi:hypothetical protein
MVLGTVIEAVEEEEEHAQICFCWFADLRKDQKPKLSVICAKGRK